MRVVRHLSTEELLLHCDGALAAELAVHLEECPACRDSWLHLRNVLFEAEAVLRSSVPPEAEDSRLASHRALERALYPPKTTEFPLRWPVIYSVAAALTVMVLSGYLSTRQAPPDAAPQMAALQTPAQIATAEVAAAPASQPIPLEARREVSTDAQPADVRIESAADLVAGLGPSEAQPVLVADSSALEAEQPQLGIERARFELSGPSIPRVESQRVAWLEPPSVAAAPLGVPAALIPTPSLITFRTVVAERASAQAERLSNPVAFANVIEGYWMLTQARVWEEDLHPVWTPRGLLIEGTVEDAAVRDRVRVAVLRQAGEPPALQIRLREDLPSQAQVDARMTRVVHSGYNGPAGGAVRRSLLSHFSDSARRSFVSPQPSALESELVRYVSEVYRSQSELLSHAYALHRFLGRVESGPLDSADPRTTRRFRDLVRFHLGALDDREAAIYDRLSEALPRKVWSHRGDAAESSDNLDWRQESDALLQDALELDSNLTALFGSSSLTVDASDPEASCGELLNRIRTRIRRIKNRTQAL